LAVSNYYEKLMEMVVLVEVPFARVVEVPKLTKSGCSYKGCADASMGLVGLGYVCLLNKFFYSDPMVMKLPRVVDSAEK
jgi:hypothetical protein